MIDLDSSALVKRYVQEPGSDAMDRLLADHPYAATSRLAHPEILSALKEDVVFACADARLLDAARAERLVAYAPG